MTYTDLIKATTGKYLKRIATGNPKRPWRYVYRQPKEQKEAEACGDCYEANGRYFMDQAVSGNRTDLLLVHGDVTGQGPLEGVRFDHSWVEDGDTVIDNANGRQVTMSKAVYYALGQIREDANVRKYSVEEFRANVIASGHWGPWQ